MYRILVVDNEAYVVESVIFYLESQEDLNAEIHGCFSALEACSIMERMRVDVLISDIRMPGMDGLQLQQRVLENWPHCRTLFLTGYPDFDYIQQAMRHGACGYLLKTEGKDAIIATVRRTLEALEETEKQEAEALKKARLEELVDSMRDQFFASLLQGVHSDEEIKTALASMQTTLDATQPVLLCIGREDLTENRLKWSEEASLLGVKELIEHEMEPYYRCYGTVYQAGSVAWLMQPRRDHASAWKHASLYLNETIEAGQKKCRLLLGRTISFALAAEVCPWPQLGDKRIRLENMLYGARGREAILIEAPVTEKAAMSSEWINREMERIDYLNTCMEMGSRQEFFQALEQIISAAGQLPEEGSAAIRLEIMGRMAVMLTGQMNRWNFWPEVGKKMDTSVLYGGLWRMPFQQAMGLLSQMADVIFEIKAQQMITSDADMVQRLHWMIEQNLGGDLSLPRLGELVGMNPYYMARCYQQITGDRLTNYISNVRMERAKKLIEEGNMLHRDIARVIGFGSEQAFNRFFKKMSGVAPRDWREKCRNGKQ